MATVLYLMKRKNKKIYFEVISNNKILFYEVVIDQDFAKLTEKKLYKGGGLDNLKYGISYLKFNFFSWYLHLPYFDSFWIFSLRLHHYYLQDDPSIVFQ